METLIAMILGGLLAVGLLALAGAGYVRWRAGRRMDDAVQDAAADAARRASGGKGEE